MEPNNIRVPIGTEYLFSDVAIYGKTDNVGGAYGTWATRLTPTSGIANGDDNQIKYFWGPALFRYQICQYNFELH